MNSALRILAVIPCLNEERHLEHLVTKLLASTASLPMRIAIVDGGSNDRTSEIAHKLAAQNPNVLFLENPKRIQSAAVNLAVSTYGADDTFLIRLDAHADYPDDFCRTLIDEAERTHAASVVVSLHTIGHGGFQDAIAAVQNSRLGHGGSAHRSGGSDGAWVDHGHHALMRMDAFRAIGGYDQTFSHNEDAEMDIRLRRAGYKIWLTRKTEITYYPRASPAALARQYFNFGNGRARTILKHRAKPKLRQLIPVGVVPAALLALLAPFNAAAVVPLLCWAAFCLGYGCALAVKAGKPVLILSGVAAMIMHLSWSAGFWKRIIQNYFASARA